MPRSGKLLLKWMKRRIEPFGYTVDIDDPVPTVKSGKEFMALVASQRPDFCEAASLDDSMSPAEYNKKDTRSSINPNPSPNPNPSRHLVGL